MKATAVGNKDRRASFTTHDLSTSAQPIFTRWATAGGVLLRRELSDHQTDHQTDRRRFPG